MQKKIILLYGRATKYLALEIAEKLKSKDVESVEVIVDVFNDSEIRPYIEKSIRGEDVFVMQSTHQPFENLFELILLGDAAKRASASSITAVIPYFGYARQDRKDKPRVPITAKVAANMIQKCGFFDRVITMDLHADQIQGFFDIPVDNIYASAIFVPYIQELNLPNLTMASPDTGGTRRASKYAEFLKTGMVLCYKNRSKPNVVGEMILLGEVKGKDIVLIDDVIDTAGTMIKATNLMLENGANSVRAFGTHPVLSKGACSKIEGSGLTELVVCNTIPLDPTCISRKIKIYSVADLLAEAIYRIENKLSISELFKVTN